MSQGFTSRGGRKRRAAGIKAKDVGHFVFRHAESGPSPQNVNRHFACENPAVIYTPDVGLELHVTASWAKIVAVTDSRTVTPLQQNLNKCSTCVPRHFNHNPPPPLLQAPSTSRHVNCVKSHSKRITYQIMLKPLVTSVQIIFVHWSDLGTGHPSGQSSPHEQHPNGLFRVFLPLILSFPPSPMLTHQHDGLISQK